MLSFVNGTLVLSIGDTIEEVSDTGFISSAPTLGVQQLGDDALLQIYPRGIRHILADKRVNEWKVGGRDTIVCATTNSRQVVIGLSSGEIVYFELDMDGQLNEFQERRAMGAEILALSIAEVPEGRQRTPYLVRLALDFVRRYSQLTQLTAIAGRRVRRQHRPRHLARPRKHARLSLAPGTSIILSRAATAETDSSDIQALTAAPSSIVMAEIVDASIDKYHATLFVNIGLQNGVLLRTVLDPLTGSLGDTRTRFLGSRPVKLARVPVQGSPAILALSSRPWLNYAYRGILQFTPLIFDSLDYAWSFSAELCPEGLIGIVGNSLRCVVGSSFARDRRSLGCTTQHLHLPSSRSEGPADRDRPLLHSPPAPHLALLPPPLHRRSRPPHLLPRSNPEDRQRHARGRDGSRRGGARARREGVWLATGTGRDLGVLRARHRPGDRALPLHSFLPSLAVY